MDRMSLSAWIAAIVVLTSILSPALSLRVVSNLKRNLLGQSKYDEFVEMTPPQESPDEPLDVDFGISLVAIQDFDTDSGIGRFHIWEKYRWMDNRLAWNPNAYSGVDDIRVPADEVWKPDIKLYTSRDVPELVDTTALVYVNHTGQVIWVPPTERVVKCKDLEGEKWACEFKYGSWTYDASVLDVDFYGDRSEIDIGDFTDPDVPEINIITHGAERHEKKYPCCPETYVDLTFTLSFEVTGSGRD